MTKDIEKVIAELNKEFGERTVVPMNEAPMDVDAIPTGSIRLDNALGVGGIPIGRVTELYGPAGAGKSSLALHIAAQAQATQEKPVCFIDMEHALDREYAATIGVDTSELLISQPSTGTAALKIVKSMIPVSSLIIVDSVPGLVTQAEIDADPGDAHVGILARLLSQNLKSIIPALGLSDCALIFVNQIREKIGVMFGSNETTPGGRALKFYASVRLDIRRAGFIGPKDARIGQECRVKAVKNKCAPPFREARFDLMYGLGISREADVLDMATDLEIIDKRGSYYYYNDENLAQGREPMKAFLANNPSLFKEIETAVRQKLFGTNGKEPEE
jgi:recombination protein RecA